MSNWPSFKKKWSAYQGNEVSAYQEHFNDLCRLLGEPTPVEADPSGKDSFCFQRFVLKDAELFLMEDDGSESPDVATGGKRERGFADVWRRGCFAWEYKGKKKNLEAAYQQFLRYRESLQNPPLLVVCDFNRYVIRTNFNGTVQETHEFTNAQVDEPRNLRLLRALFGNPEALRPQKTTVQVTEKLAREIADIARSLQGRESVELADARTRKQVNTARRHSLRIARFLNRIIFCLFAEDTGLLPKGLFTGIARAGIEDPERFAERLETLFRLMATGGEFGLDRIAHFNGHLFEEATVFELSPEEIRALALASESDWQSIEPSILGTLFERSLDPDQRAQLGAQYTSRADIETLVEPVLMEPLRREWAALKSDLRPVLFGAKGKPADRARLVAFGDKLAGTVILDPACGSGNFLYVSLQLLLSLEKELLAFGTQLGFTLPRQVSVGQLRGIEINPYAFELAQVAVQIGALQWQRENGFPLDRRPVLQSLEGFFNHDALLRETFRRAPKNLRAAQEEEHQPASAVAIPFGSEQAEIADVGAGQGEFSERPLAPVAPVAVPKTLAALPEVRVYNERAWPKCDVIVGNPPYLGDKLMRGELGDNYVEELRKIYGNRIPGQSDLCCYWFEKSRQQIEDGNCKRAGLLATQGIRGGANREVLKRIKSTGDIFFAESDREWILAGATVHVSMIAFDAGNEKNKQLNGLTVENITPNLAGKHDTSVAVKLVENELIGFVGVAQKAPFDLAESDAEKMLSSPNPNGRPNSDVLVPIRNAEDLTRGSRHVWNVDFGLARSLDESALYELPFEHIRKVVYPIRLNHREARQTRYW